MPTEIVLREFQVDAIRSLSAACATKRRLLLQAPTGAGKTVIASKIIQDVTAKNKRVLFLAHRRELVDQCVRKLDDFGVPSGTIMSGEPWDASRPVNVASIQTLHSWAVKRKRVGFPRADLVVIDEAHHYNSSKTWQDVVKAYPQAFILGMTATPINRRGRGLGHFFDEMVKCPSIGDLTARGYLVPARYFAPSPVDLKGLKVVMGDYSEKELEGRMDVPKLIGDIVENWAKYGENRQTIVFSSGVRHSIHIAEQFNKIGIPWAHVDGNTPKDERDKIVNDFAAGRIRGMSNCAVFTEGFDCPSASCLIFARPTKSLLLYLQVAGRVLRSSAGKKDAIVLDHSGVIYEHGPVDQDWDWRLDYGEGDVRTVMRGEKKLKKEITCENCKSVYFGKLICPECHHKPTVRGREIHTYEGYLQALDELENPRPVEKKTFYRMMKGYAVAKDKKPGLAYFKYIEKYNEKPPHSWRDLSPLEPNPEVAAWILKQNRSYYWKQKNPNLAAYNDRRAGGMA